jgi:hypothetical protein
MQYRRLGKNSMASYPTIPCDSASQRLTQHSSSPEVSLAVDLPLLFSILFTNAARPKTQFVRSL